MAAPQQGALPVPAAVSGGAPPSYDDSQQKVPGGPPPGTQFLQGQYPQGMAPGPSQQPPFGQYPPGAYPPFAQPQIQYVLSSNIASVVAAPKASFPGPHTFLAYTLIVGIACCVLNPPSAIFAIPAFVFAGVSASKKTSRQYSSASRMATYAFVMTTISLIFSVLTWLVYIAVMISLASRETSARCNSIVYTRSGGYECRYYF